METKCLMKIFTNEKDGDLMMKEQNHQNEDFLT